MTTRVINDESCHNIVESIQAWDWSHYLKDKTTNEAYVCFHQKIKVDWWRVVRDTSVK